MSTPANIRARSSRNDVTSLAERLKDALWPRTCTVHDCGRPSDRPGSYICSRCHATLPWYDEFENGAFAYLEPVSRLVNIFKFNGAEFLTADLSDAMALSFRKKHDATQVDAVIPVPLHPRRLAMRGYNQSALLAKAFARRIDRLCDETSLARIRDTEYQSRLSGEERRRNLKGAFRVIDRPRIRGRVIVLVDDVMTTGSTIAECTETLLESGAHKVIPFVLAKAILDEDLDSVTATA